MKSRYDKNPNSIISKIWKWHLPGVRDGNHISSLCLKMKKMK